MPSRAFEGVLFKANAERGAMPLYVCDLEGCFAAFLGCTLKISKVMGPKSGRIGCIPDINAAAIPGSGVLWSRRA